MSPLDLPVSMWDEIERLRSLVKDNTLVRHYLEPGERAPKIYSADYSDGWLECLMRITDVGNAVPVIGSTASDQLCSSLWGDKGECCQ